MLFETYYDKLKQRWTQHRGGNYSGRPMDCGCAVCKIFHQACEIHVALEQINIQSYWPRPWNAEWSQDKIPLYNKQAEQFMSEHPLEAI
jgi:hypothetical protein